MNRIEQIKRGSTVALDTVVLAYFLERHEQHFKPLKAFFHKIERGLFGAVMSSLVFAELLVPAYRLGRHDLAEKTFKYLDRFPNLSVAPVSSVIARKAASLRARYGLRTPDSLHAATALERKADLILTNDRHFSRVQEELPVLYLDKGLSSP